MLKLRRLQNSCEKTKKLNLNRNVEKRKLKPRGFVKEKKGLPKRILYVSKLEKII